MSLTAMGLVWAQPVDSFHSSAERFVMLALADCLNEATGLCCPSARFLAAKVGLADERSVRRHIDSLEIDGWVEKVRRKRRGDGTLGVWEFTLNVEKLHRAATPAGPTVDRASMPAGDRAATPAGDRAPTPAQEPEREPEGEPEAPMVPLSDDEAVVDAVFRTWVEATGKAATARLSADRKRKVLARLHEGYPLEDLVDAARGIACSSFHMGDNDQRKRYDDLALVMRSGSKVEHFRDLYRAGGEERPARPASPLDAMGTALQGFIDDGRVG